jgi:cytochrome b pre-mRNA-processing protein 3
MKFQLFAVRPARPAEANIDALYGAIVAQARLPSFYMLYGVPDTVDGRLDMIVLHLVLLLRRLARDGGPKSGPRNGSRSDLSQRVFDRFCTDIDDNFREMGVGDLSVPKKMQAVGASFYGRARAYDEALDGSGDVRTALTAALARNVFGAPAGVEAAHLAAYVLAADRALATTDVGAVAVGQLAFPDPDSIVDTTS